MIYIKAFIYFMFALVFVYAGCSKKQEKQNGENKADTSKSVLILPEEMDKGFDSVKPSFDDAYDELYLPGRVDFNPNNLTRVFSLVNGIMTKIYVNQGDYVKKGQVLAEVFSSDYSNAVSDMQKAAAQLENSRKSLDRVKKLSESSISSEKDIEAAERDYNQSLSEYERSEKIVKLLGGNPRSGSASYYLTAPIDGVVIDRGAQQGSQVRSDGSQNLFTIGKAGDVWVTLALYQDQFDLVQRGDRVVLKFDGLNDSVYQSRVENISTDIDPATMTAKIRCNIENIFGKLKPGMYCSGKIFHKSKEGVFLPSNAVFYDSNGKTYVFLKAGKGRYVKKEVSTGRKFPDRTEITSGVSAQDDVVANHSIFLNDELKLRAE